LIGAAGPLLAAIAFAALPHDGAPKPSPARGSAKVTSPPLKLELLRPARPTPAQRVMPGLH